MKELKRTSKARIRSEFNTGDKQPVIVKRLHAEGLGRIKNDGEIVPWTQPAFSITCVGMGLRRVEAFTKGPNKKTPRAPRAVRAEPTMAASILKFERKPKNNHGVIRAILQAKNVDAEARIAVALTFLED